MANVEWPLEIRALRSTLETISAVSDPDALRARIADLSAKASVPDLWDDPNAAQKVTTALSQSQGELERLTKLTGRIDDLEALVEMATEAGSAEAVAEAEVMAEAEAEFAKLRKDLGELEVRTLLNGKYDQREAVVTIRSGAGGVDAADFAEMLLRMYLRWTERKGLHREVMDYQPGDEAGIKSATLTISGDYAYGMLSAEAGVHRLVRISPFDQAARRHTSFASVYVWPELPDDVEVEIDEKDLRIDTYRSSGCGGQHLNVTDSAVRITHLPSGIVVTCQNERSQGRNRDSAMKVLRSRLYDLKMKEQQARLDQLGGEKREIAFGSQIRSYVLHPYQMVKDHRTKEEVGDINRILDGDIDIFIKAYLKQKAAGTLGQPSAADND